MMSDDMSQDIPKHPRIIRRNDWQMQCQIKADRCAAAKVLASAQEEAKRLNLEAKQKVIQMQAEAQQQATAMAEQAKAAGYTEGYTKGMGEGHARAAKDLHCAIQTHHAAMAKIEDHVMQTVCEVMEKLFFMHTPEERLRALVRHALVRLDIRCGELRLSVHPDQVDILKLKSHQWLVDFPLLHCHLQADPSLGVEAYRIEGDGWRAEGDAVSTFAQVFEASRENSLNVPQVNSDA